MQRDLAGKVFLLTGATEGIGKAAAVNFAKRGATLVITARNREKGERVADALRTFGGDGPIELLVGDLSVNADARRIASEFRAKHDRLDVLVNNAGAVFASHRVSADGIEMTFALNHVAYFVVTEALLDVLKQTPGARIVSTSSAAHQRARLDLDTVATRPSGYSAFSAYGDSKLANILFTRELARRLEGSGVTANCFHPGFVRTGFGQNNGGLMAGVISLGGMLFGRSPEKGAETLVWLATSPDAATQSGKYFFDCAVKRTSNPRAVDDALAGQLWALTDRLSHPT